MVHFFARMEDSIPSFAGLNYNLNYNKGQAGKCMNRKACDLFFILILSSHYANDITKFQPWDNRLYAKWL